MTSTIIGSIISTTGCFDAMLLTLVIFGVLCRAIPSESGSPADFEFRSLVYDAKNASTSKANNINTVMKRTFEYISILLLKIFVFTTYFINVDL